MRVCVIGNSHAGSLKRGWDLIKDDYKDHSITFFASPRQNMQALELKNEALVPKTRALSKHLSFTSGGQNQINIKDYDIFLLYGLGMRLPFLDARLSTAVLDHTFDDILFSSLSYRISKFIRPATDLPVFIAYNPRPAINVAENQSIKFLTHADIVNRMNKLIDIENTRIIPQPADTLSDGYNTKPEYRKGSIRLEVSDQTTNTAQPPEDKAHMNAEFGADYLRYFFDTILAK